MYVVKVIKADLSRFSKAFTKKQPAAVFARNQTGALVVEVYRGTKLIAKKAHGRENLTWL